MKLVWAAACSFVVVGCGGSSPSSSGLPRSSTVLSLTPAQGAVLCDWINQSEGGYGRTVDCPTGPLATDANQSDCVNALPDLEIGCPALTVGQIEDCAQAEGSNLCNYNTALACAPLRACSCSEG
jgi:hypothetical protein